MARPYRDRSEEGSRPGGRGMEAVARQPNIHVAGLRVDYDTLVRSLDPMLAGHSQAEPRPLLLEERGVVLPAVAGRACEVT